MQEHDNDILKLDKEQEELFNLVKFICNKIAAIVRVFPDTQDVIELLIEGYKVDADCADIQIFAEDGSFIRISEHDEGSRMYCSGRYEEDFNMIQYEKCVDFDGSQTPQDIESFKFIIEHDPKIFIPLFAIAKNLDKTVQACILQIDIDIQRQMQYVNKKKKDRNVMERLAAYLKSDRYLQKLMNNGSREN